MYSITIAKQQFSFCVLDRLKAGLQTQRSTVFPVRSPGFSRCALRPLPKLKNSSCREKKCAFFSQPLMDIFLRGL